MKWQRDKQPALDPAIDPDDLAPPTWHRAREMAWLLPRLLGRLGHLDARGPEEGPPVLVIPGFLASDRATIDLRRALGRSGWRAHPWKMGVNRGAQPDTLARLTDRVGEIGDGGKVLLVGWSLGGLYARAVAHHAPETVRGVVTLASPFSGDPKTNTNVRALYERVAGHDVNHPPFAKPDGKPPVPTLAFWSRRDGVVAPSAARGAAHEVDHAVELDVYHGGMVLDRPALSHVCFTLRSFLEEHEGCCPIHGTRPN